MNPNVQLAKREMVAQSVPLMEVAKRQNWPLGSIDSTNVVAKLPLAGTNSTAGVVRPLLRVELGEVLRSMRLEQGRTLREVSSDAQVSLGYLSEVERGQKEASSELLESICDALGEPLWLVLRKVSDRLALAEQPLVPNTVPEELLADPVCAGLAR